MKASTVAIAIDRITIVKCYPYVIELCYPSE